MIKNKKYVFLVSISVICALCVILIWSLNKTKKHVVGLTQNSCVFCNPAFLEVQAFYEDEHAVGLVTYTPTFQYHSLIIPKKHVMRFEDLTQEETLHITNLIQKTQQAIVHIQGPTDYYLLQKNGKNAGQNVMHVHVHYVPVPQKPIWPPFIYIKSCTRSLFPVLTKNEMRALAQKIRHAFEEVEDSNHLNINNH